MPHPFKAGHFTVTGQCRQSLRCCVCKIQIIVITARPQDLHHPHRNQSTMNDEFRCASKAPFTSTQSRSRKNADKLQRNATSAPRLVHRIFGNGNRVRDHSHRLGQRVFTFVGFGIVSFDLVWRFPCLFSFGLPARKYTTAAKIARATEKTMTVWLVGIPSEKRDAQLKSLRRTTHWAYSTELVHRHVSATKNLACCTLVKSV